MNYTEEMLRFNPKRDICPVDQEGFVDLVAAFDNRVIPSNLNDVNLVEDPCEDTEACFGKPRDQFDLLQQHATIRENLDKKSNPVDQS